MPPVQQLLTKGEKFIRTSASGNVNMRYLFDLLKKKLHQIDHKYISAIKLSVSIWLQKPAEWINCATFHQTMISVWAISVSLLLTFKWPQRSNENLYFNCCYRQFRNENRLMILHYCPDFILSVFAMAQVVNWNQTSIVKKKECSYRALSNSLLKTAKRKWDEYR